MAILPSRAFHRLSKVAVQRRQTVATVARGCCICYRHESLSTSDLLGDATCRAPRTHARASLRGQCDYLTIRLTHPFPSALKSIPAHKATPTCDSHTQVSLQHRGPQPRQNPRMACKACNLQPKEKPMRQHVTPSRVLRVAVIHIGFGSQQELYDLEVAIPSCD